jgi:hypothetical protein
MVPSDSIPGMMQTMRGCRARLSSTREQVWGLFVMAASHSTCKTSNCITLYFNVWIGLRIAPIVCPFIFSRLHLCASTDTPTPFQRNSMTSCIVVLLLLVRRSRPHCHHGCCCLNVIIIVVVGCIRSVPDMLLSCSRCRRTCRSVEVISHNRRRSYHQRYHCSRSHRPCSLSLSVIVYVILVLVIGRSHGQIRSRRRSVVVILISNNRRPPHRRLSKVIIIITIRHTVIILAPRHRTSKWTSCLPLLLVVVVAVVILCHSVIVLVILLVVVRFCCQSHPSLVVVIILAPHCRQKLYQSCSSVVIMWAKFLKWTLS